MTIFISSIFIILIFLFLWILLISTKNSRTNEEQYIEDNLQMQFCKVNASCKRKETIKNKIISM